MCAEPLPTDALVSVVVATDVIVSVTVFGTFVRGPPTFVLGLPDTGTCTVMVSPAVLSLIDPVPDEETLVTAVLLCVCAGSCAVVSV